MTQSAAAPAILVPVSASERSFTIDALRGFALFGILLVNIELFAHPMQSLLFPIDPGATSSDRILDWVVRFSAEGKFYTMFSFLFGLGFGIQLLRAGERGISHVPMYLRRITVLLLIGLLHLFLVWVGDILSFYGLLGFVLLLYRNAKTRTLVVWAIVLLALPALLAILSGGAVFLGRAMGPEIAKTIDTALAQSDSLYRAQLAQAAEVYANGSFADVVAQRALDSSLLLYGYMSMGPTMLAMFLLGLVFAKKGIFRNVDEHVPLVRRILLWCGLAGVAGSAVYATLIQDSPRLIPTIPVTIANVAYALSSPALSLAYVSALTLLLRGESWRRRFALIAAAGRMPLSNYLAQSLICTFVFYGYGLGYFGRTDQTTEVIIAVVLYAVLVSASWLWISRFSFGPMEWLWRRLAYGRVVRRGGSEPSTNA